MTDEAEHDADNDIRERIQKLLITGDNRLKQGVAPEKVRATYEQALALAREAGLEERIRPLVEIRLADLDRLQRSATTDPSGPPATLRADRFQPLRGIKETLQ